MLRKRYDMAWCRKLAQLLEQGHPTPFREIQKLYSVPVAHLEEYRLLVLKAIEAEKAGRLVVKGANA